MINGREPCQILVVPLRRRCERSDKLMFGDDRENCTLQHVQHCYITLCYVTLVNLLRLLLLLYEFNCRAARQDVGRLTHKQA